MVIITINEVTPIVGSKAEYTQGSTGDMHRRPRLRNKTARNTQSIAGIKESCYSSCVGGRSKDRMAGWVARYPTFFLNKLMSYPSNG